MSQSSRRWVKVWHEVLTDPHFQNLSLEQQARFYNLLVYVSQHGERGVLTVEAPARYLLTLMQCSNYDELVTLIAQLPNVQIVKKCYASFSVTLKGWTKYQIETTACERMRKHRKQRNVTLQEKEKEKEKDKDKEEDKDKDSAREFFDLWNQYAEKSNLVSAKELGRKRVDKCRLRLSERPLEDWEKVFSLCARTPFLNGENKNWRASFDWIIANSDNAVKVLEGKYGDPQAEYCKPGKAEGKDRRAQIMDNLE